jgi:DNA primase small subunit
MKIRNKKKTILAQDQKSADEEELKFFIMLKIGVKREKRKSQSSLNTWAPGYPPPKRKVVKKKKKKKIIDQPKLNFSSSISTAVVETFGDPMPKTTYTLVTLGHDEDTRIDFDVREKMKIVLDDPEHSLNPGRSLLAKSDSFGAMMIDQKDKDCASILPPVFMSDYYRVAFPVDLIMTMATAGGMKTLPYSEIAMVINGVWWRNKVFEGAHSFKDFIVNKSPSRIEIGPIHSLPVRKTGSEFKSDYLKLLVFDIDVDDDHYIRWCECKGYKMTCMKCWALTIIGIKITVHLLKSAFGFEHILEVYSGRRGAHIWVFDKKTLEYSADTRQSIVDFIDKHRNPSTFGSKDGDILYKEVIEPAFEEIYLDGDALAEMSISKYVLLRIPSQASRNRVSDAWWGKTTGWDMWRVIEEELPRGLYEAYKKQVAFGLLWVHLDTAVTTKLDHLVKSPFVIHPGTGHICTPIPYHDWTPEEALTKEMVMRTPELLKPYIDHTKLVLDRAYN